MEPNDKEWATNIAPAAENLMRDWAEKGKVQINEETNTMSATGSIYKVAIFKEEDKMVVYNTNDDNRIVAAINRDTGKGVYADPTPEDKNNWQKIKESYEGRTNKLEETIRPKEEMEI